MVIPIFIHKHDQQIPRNNRAGEQEQEQEQSLCTVCLRMWSAAYLLWIHAVVVAPSLPLLPHSLECLFLLPVASLLYSFIALCDAFNSFDSFGYTQAAFNLNQYTASECHRRTLTRSPTCICHSLVVERHSLPLPGTIQKIPKWVCFAVEWVLD